MLRYIDRSAAVLAAECQSLKNANEKQCDWCSDSDGCVRWQKTDGSGSASHYQKCDEECVLASDKVSDTSKEESAEGTNDETDRERGEICDERQRVIALGVEQW